MPAAQELAVVMALLLSVGCMAVFGFILISSLRELVTDMEQYEKRLKVLGAQATKLLDRHGADLLTTQLELAVRPCPPTQLSSPPHRAFSSLG
jgi:predicted PurR-regulated permease PerM